MANSDQQGDSTPARTTAGRYLLGGACALLIAALAYNTFGKSEGTPPDASEAGAGPQSIEDLRSAAEAAPDDAKAWQALGFAYFMRGEFAEAVTAYERAVAIDDGEAVLWSALGEARVMASTRDPMPPAALEAFTRASRIDPKDPRARYFLNVQKDLTGDHQGAIAGWLALLRETPAGAPWESDLIRTIEQVGKLRAITVKSQIDAALAARTAVTAPAAAPVRGPSQADIAAAGSIPPSEQRAMAESMVARLEQRLKTDPADPGGWVMLMRSRMTLGQPDLARAARDQAIRANPQEAARLRQEAEALGIR